MAYDFGFLNNMDEFQAALQENDAMITYFNSSSCNVGEALAPKVMKLLDEKFPKVKFFYVDRELSPDIAGHYSVFVEPTILIFFVGKETLRKSRHFSIDELEAAIQRPYQILFG